MALNPISFTEQVVSDFLRYQLTTYPLADTSLHAQLKALLRLEESRQTPLRHGPFVSLSRPFAPGATVAELVRRGELHAALEKIADFPSVRKHQEDAITAIRRKETTLVATGTGSGKTEAFLYPIISRCFELKDSGAPPGILAVLIYPMNALAEDQLDRLRGLLAGSGIPFGMYVGKTPDDEAAVRGERLAPGSSRADYAARMKQIRLEGLPTSLLPPEERASRASMRKDGGQPRILLTNVKQLELLLTRGKDVGLFANAPLEFLVFDEAHTFRGAQGAETACLIRRLRTFCGKRPDEVTCVATSATMADPIKGVAAGKDFARRFFGVDAAKVTLVGEQYEVLRWNERRATPTGPGDAGPDVLTRVLAAVEQGPAEVGAALSACLVDLGGARLPRDDWQKALTSQLASNDLVFRLAESLRAPRALEDVCLELTKALDRDVTEHEVLAWLALGVASGYGERDPFLRPVVHSFIRGIHGAVATFGSAAEGARLWLGGEDAASELGDSRRRFPLLSCTTCGQHYYETWVKDFGLVAKTTAPPEGGDLVGSVRVWEHLGDELGGVRALFVDRLVVRPDEDDEETDEESDDEGEVAISESSAEPLPAGHDYDHRRLAKLYVCGRCGAFQDQEQTMCASCRTGSALVPIQVVRSKEGLPGVLHSCVACQAPGRRPGGGKYREPARPVRATSVADVHVLAQSMLHLSADRARLLVFADNRQDAAFQAGWMRDHARRFRLRTLMAKAIPIAGASVGDVAQELDGELERDVELSRALVPEVWQVAPRDDAGTKHREERLYFLRLQVLREVATGVKQRLGLEPWGRVRIDYLGLEPGDEFFTRWAQHLECEQVRLIDGVGALLDHLRRIRTLSDPTKLFSKLWLSGDKELQYGYVPAFSGGPRGVKLSRATSDLPARITQWIGTRTTQIWDAVESWGLSGEDTERFLRELWEYLTRKKLLVPTLLEGWGRPLKGSAGAHQVDAGKLLLRPHRGRWRCEKCRRTTVRRGPTSLCLAWRCRGKLFEEETDPDDFDLHVLDGEYAMLRVAEHSAQVPTAVRERMENQFKGSGDQLNTLVCTPTLELGVDIGALDAVLMRNVPPSAASYWQRVGRAGRRHRMAVDVTYAQATGFDQAFFHEPLKLLGGLVEPPRFNLKNDLMIRKHVHATVLTSLHGIARRASDGTREQIEGVLKDCFPSTLKPYLFLANDDVRPNVLDVSSLGTLIKAHRDLVLSEVERVFTRAWPAEDIAAVDMTRLAAVVDAMAESLSAVLKRFKKRLDWASGELRRLAVAEQQKGVLDPEDQAHRRRCQRIIERLKGQAQRNRSQAQGGADDSDTMGALAREGFLPGYGLESGTIVGTAEPPRMTYGLDDFELPRAPTLALREYVPGNAIYANGFRFVPRRYQLTPDETMRFRVDVERQVALELGVDSATAPLAEAELRAVPVCDVMLPSQSQISDEEEFRFQMPVAIYANDRGFHRGGSAFGWGQRELYQLRGVSLRMVNVGPRSEVQDSDKHSLGYLLCLACGQSHSPYASQKSRDDFCKKHLERCSHRVLPTGFFANVEVDVLKLRDAERTAAFSVMEALRIGASRVLDMEVEDLQLLGLGRPGEDTVDVLLYDPMPGGSGLLEHLTQRWDEVRTAALAVARDCPAACERACIDCLKTYRNRFYHEHLDRKEAVTALEEATGPLNLLRALPENLPTTTTTSGQGQTHIENRFKRLLAEAGLPVPTAQKRIVLDSKHHTIPDFFYEGDSTDEPGICIYLDGMSGHIHGNKEAEEQDRYLRAKLRGLDYEVVEVRSFELDDRNAVTRAVGKIARYLVGKDRAGELRADTAWFERAAAPTASVGRVLRLTRLPAPTPDSVPVYDLRVAAGAFSDGQRPTAIEHVRLDGLALRPGFFVAQIAGSSMDQIAPNGSWCLWEHLGAAGAAPARNGDRLIVRRATETDPELGEFTFKELVEKDGKLWLMPRSSVPHASIPADPANLHAVARWIGVAVREVE